MFSSTFIGEVIIASSKSTVGNITNYKNAEHDIPTSQCFVWGTLIVTVDGDRPIEVTLFILPLQKQVRANIKRYIRCTCLCLCQQ